MAHNELFREVDHSVPRNASALALGACCRPPHIAEHMNERRPSWVLSYRARFGLDDIGYDTIARLRQDPRFAVRSKDRYPRARC